MLGDLRHAVRRLRKQPGYAAAAILALALGNWMQYRAARVDPIIALRAE